MHFSELKELFAALLFHFSKMKLRIFISLSLIATAVTALDSDLITAFLKEINVKSTIIFDCFVRKKGKRLELVETITIINISFLQNTWKQSNIS